VPFDSDYSGEDDASHIFLLRYVALVFVFLLCTRECFGILLMLQGASWRFGRSVQGAVEGDGWRAQSML